MAYGILRIKKYKNDSIRGIENHMERRATTTNPDIKKSETKNNYDLTGLQDRTLKSLIKDRLKECGIDKVRKNGVTMVELLFTASHEFFENMSSQEIHSYFQKCYEFACNKYGKENIIAANVHLDEYTPHMHIELVPINKDNKLNAKSLFNHKLEELQDLAHKQVFEQYGLERGNTHKEVKHISTLNFKIITLEQKVKEKQQELRDIQNELDNNQLYKMRQDIKALQDKLKTMFSVLESDPQLMEEYRKAVEQMKYRDEQEKEI